MGGLRKLVAMGKEKMIAGYSISLFELIGGAIVTITLAVGAATITTKEQLASHGVQLTSQEVRLEKSENKSDLFVEHLYKNNEVLGRLDERLSRMERDIRELKGGLRGQ